MSNGTEYVYCEGGPLDGQFKSVNKSTTWFNVIVENQDYGNGPQNNIHHYERTTRTVETTNGSVVVFYSNPDWDR